MNNITGQKHDENSVGKFRNSGNIGEIVKTRTQCLARYDHQWTKKKSQNGHFSQRMIFAFTLGFVDVFGQTSYPKRPKKGTFLPEVLFQRSQSCVGKGPTQRNTLKHEVNDDAC